MKYKVKKKADGTQKQNEREVKSSLLKSSLLTSTLSKKGKMLFLMIWGVICVTLYLSLSKVYAITPVVLQEIFILIGVIGLLFCSIAAKLESAKIESGADNDERLVLFQDGIRILKIFILPPTVIVLVDMLISIYRFSTITM